MKQSSITEIEMNRTGLIDPETPVGLTERDFTDEMSSVLYHAAHEFAGVVFQSKRHAIGAARYPFSAHHPDGAPVDDEPPVEVMVLMVSGDDELKNRLTEVLQAAAGQEMEPVSPTTDN